ncbi:MAG: hypothetical protein HFJ46_08045 [Clostridia bacterium]|nr:hypothetical protein [Clostridia bacterium]
MNKKDDMYDEFKMFQPSEYETVMKALGPDSRFHYLVHNKTQDKFGYLFNKRYSEDDSHYAPYLMYKMAKKIGINAPETELGIYLEKDIDLATYRDSFYEASLVYRPEWDSFSFRMSNLGLSYAAQEVVQAIYFQDNPEVAQKSHTPRKTPITVDEYIMSNIYFITSRGSKPKDEYTEEEISSIKQELIDRLMFGLKFGIDGQTSIRMFEHANARLDTYYLSSSNMLDLNLHYDWINDMLKIDDKEFLEQVDREHKPQYGISPYEQVPNAKKVLNYIYKKYPKEAENSYKKISLYTKADFEEELNSLKRLSPEKKKFAIRFFDVKQKEFASAYQEHLKAIRENDEIR